MLWLLTPKFITVFVFTAAIGLAIFFDNWKNKLVWASVVILFLSGSLTVRQAANSVEFDVLLLYVGMLFIGEVLMYSKVPDYIATHLASKMKTAEMAMLMMCVVTGFLSMFIMNIAVILILAPVALSICKKCRIDPVPLFIGMVLVTNLEGTATLIGDPPSMLLGIFDHLRFTDFIVFEGKPGIFFAAQAGMLSSLPILYLFFRKYDHKMPAIEPEGYKSLAPVAIVISLILALAVSSSASRQIPHQTGLICLFFGILSYLWYRRASKDRDIAGFMRRLDWHTGFFLAGVLILVGSLTASGVVEDISAAIIKGSGTSPFNTYLLVVSLSLLASAFILNIPYIAFMIPVTDMVGWQVALDNHALLFGLLLSGSLGGNITPIGASANIVAIGILKEHGHDCKFMDFIKIGLPYTLVAAMASCGFIWLMFS